MPSLELVFIFNVNLIQILDRFALKTTINAVKEKQSDKDGMHGMGDMSGMME